jgi:2-iminobutanoate/2-iminopropanoate deaminase
MVIFDNPATLPAPVGQYSHAARAEVGDKTILQLSGQAAIDTDGKIVGGNDMAAQAEYIMDNITAILSAHGATLADVVNIRAYLTDIASFPSMARYERRASPGHRRPSQPWRCPACSSPARSLRSRSWPLPESLRRRRLTAVGNAS